MECKDLGMTQKIIDSAGIDLTRMECKDRHNGGKR